MSTPSNITCVEQALAAVVPTPSQGAELFYGRLSDLNLPLYRAFQSDTVVRESKLTRVFGIAVANLCGPVNLARATDCGAPSSVITTAANAGA